MNDRGGNIAVSSITKGDELSQRHLPRRNRDQPAFGTYACVMAIADSG